jgi:hypothetical protein
MGGWSAVKALRARGGGEEKSDERVLGSGDFVEALLEDDSGHRAPQDLS